MILILLGVNGNNDEKETGTSYKNFIKLSM